jgi:hypothetical protein
MLTDAGVSPDSGAELVSTGDMEPRERLGGLLNYYYRRAA